MCISLFFLGYLLGTETTVMRPVRFKDCLLLCSRLLTLLIIFYLLSGLTSSKHFNLKFQASPLTCSFGLLLIHVTKPLIFPPTCLFLTVLESKSLSFILRCGLHHSNVHDNTGNLCCCSITNFLINTTTLNIGILYLKLILCCQSLRKL